MATRNDITGDLIKSRVSNKQFEDNFDNIFRKKDPLCDICGKTLNAVKECAFTGCPLNWDEKRADIIGSNGNIGYEEEDIT
jgi:hypothetical protein